MEILPRVGLQAVLITGLIGGIFALVAVIIIGIGIYVRGRAQASKRWPMVLGQVIESRVTSSSSSEGGTTYEPHIQYAFDLGGQVYHSNRVAFGGFVSTSNPRDAQKHTARYPVGAVVQVYYNPANPPDATLERRAGNAGFLLAFGGLFLVIGCGLSGLPAALYVARLFIP
ncbi:MAG: DUF3592 domain-containing protein [Anaerolineales bacterium]|nr:DUF3592 domain-containing protein [Anaerolineales bacterium]